MGRLCATQAGVGKSLSLEIGFLSPCGREGFFCLLFWPPARRAARRGRLWGCAPFSAPLASPPKHPRRAFHIPSTLRATSALTPGNPAGPSCFRNFARSARPLLRELPSLRSGDLPARRAMPSFAFSLYEKVRAVRTPQTEQFHFEIALTAARADVSYGGVSTVYLRG